MVNAFTIFWFIAALVGFGLYAHERRRRITAQSWADVLMRTWERDQAAPHRRYPAVTSIRCVVQGRELLERLRKNPGKSVREVQDGD